MGTAKIRDRVRRLGKLSMPYW